MTKTSCSVMEKRVSCSCKVRATIFYCQCVECRGLVSVSATKELDTERDKEINNLVYGIRDHVTVSEDRDSERTSVCLNARMSQQSSEFTYRPPHVDATRADGTVKTRELPVDSWALSEPKGHAQQRANKRRCHSSYNNVVLSREVATRPEPHRRICALFAPRGLSLHDNGRSIIHVNLHIRNARSRHGEFNRTSRAQWFQ